MKFFVNRRVIPETPLQEGIGTSRVVYKVSQASRKHNMHVFVNEVIIYVIVMQSIDDNSHLHVCACVIVTQKAYEEGSIQVVMEQAS